MMFDESREAFSGERWSLQSGYVWLIVEIYDAIFYRPYCWRWTDLGFSIVVHSTKPCNILYYPHWWAEL